MVSKPPTAPTAPTSRVTYDSIEYKVVREGLAEILNPVSPVQDTKSESNGKQGKSEAPSVFYNPIQQFNRDLSVLAIRVFAEQLVELRTQKYKTKDRPNHRSNKRRKLNTEEQKTTEISNREPPSDDVKQVPDKAKEADTDMVDAIAIAEQAQGNTKDSENSTNTNEQQPQKDIAQIREPPRPKVRVLDALSASGLRALRYAQEISNISEVVANDLSASATKAIDVNIKHNHQEKKIRLNTGDAIDYMSKMKGQFEVVDLDPYGTAGPFIDAAVQAMTNDGLLCVTCTDSAVFAAAGYCEKTFAVYGGMPIKGPHSHEGGLRLLLHAIATSAARYGIAIEPLLSLSIDFYIRVFVKVRRSAAEVKYLASKTMLVYGCDSGCGSWTTQPLGRLKANESKNGTSYFSHGLAQAPTQDSSCPHCGFTTHLQGPMWAGPIHNPYFIQNMLDTLQTLPEDTYGTKVRMEGMLIMARDETLLSIPTVEPVPGARIPPHVKDDHPFFFLTGPTAGILHCVAPSTAQLRGALLRLGYRVTRSHCKPGSIKTNAPWDVIWEIWREWIRKEKPIKEENIKSGSVARFILEKRRDNRDSLADIRDDLKRIGANKEVEKKDLQTKLEAMLYKLSHVPEQDDQIDGEEENASEAIERKVPLHKLKIVFDEALGKKAEENQGKKLVRYQVNPRANWGPMTKARRN